MSNKEPKAVLEAIVDNGDTVNSVIRIYPMTISRYAYLELLESPFIGNDKKFEMRTIIPAAYVMTHTPAELKKYNSKSIDQLISDSYEWADENLAIDDIPDLMKNIIEQIAKINKAAPQAESGSSESVSDSKKK